MALFLASFLMVSNYVTAQDNEINSDDVSSVSLAIQHGIGLPWGPGFRIIISGWGSKTELSIYIIDRDAKEFEIISPEKHVTSGENGEAMFDIPYKYKDMVPGVCIILVAGPLGIHQITTEIPKVIEPSKENPKWQLQFETPVN